MRFGGFLATTIGIAAAGGVASGGGGNPPPVSFEADVQPIFDENCVTCHQSSGAPQGLVLEDGKSWHSLLHGRSAESKLPLVAPGRPDESYLFHKLAGSQTRTGSGARMPPGDPLAPDEVAIVQRWIAAGALNN
jgi:mono/diheme cytochrome c family protein